MRTPEHPGLFPARHVRSFSRRAGANGIVLRMFCIILHHVIELLLPDRETVCRRSWPQGHETRKEIGQSINPAKQTRQQTNNLHRSSRCSLVHHRGVGSTSGSPSLVLCCSFPRRLQRGFEATLGNPNSELFRRCSVEAHATPPSEFSRSLGASGRGHISSNSPSTIQFFDNISVHSLKPVPRVVDKLWWFADRC